MLNAKDKIGEEVIRKIKIKGFSKIPIFDQNRNNVIGF